ncbi:MAG: putative siderophore transport system ATP-binding protein YusV [Candidatus Methanoperedenaceae archaeon GB37]|nr:putative siderophore transport system ATP-binding protein YusV [Candidatus Methanoperedenaceae archaeon GB37]CAD7783623.1 MAG: putative siderophore transport system ATP-binding protein YusV [Candidatus Methanoperedenaceae archaeon GB37]
MLEVKGLTCGYNKRFILKNINFKLKNHALLGIIGPNGSGKTTLLRAITKIIKPQKGKILFEGRDIWQMGFRELAQKMAFVPQAPLSYEVDMTVEEFVLLGRIPYHKVFQFLDTKYDKAVAKKAMALTHTLNIKDRFIPELSGGERQLVYLARALAQEPKLLLLDEPTAHLDIAHQIKILDLIKNLNNSFKLTVIIVLHDLNLASQYCNELILLNNGYLYKMGTPQEILTAEIIEHVYQTKVIVKEKFVSSRPYIFWDFHMEDLT